MEEKWKTEGEAKIDNLDNDSNDNNTKHEVETKKLRRKRRRKNSNKEGRTEVKPSRMPHENTTSVQGHVTEQRSISGD